MEADEATHDGDQAAAAGERPSDDEDEGGNDLEEEDPDMWEIREDESTEAQEQIPELWVHLQREVAGMAQSLS